jgi:large subunit ribosomal protein L9
MGSARVDGTESYMEVILKEDVAKLGSRGDVVKVAEGYGRNFLLPKKLAIEATTANRAVIEQMKAAAVRRLAREKGDAEALGRQLAGVELAFTRKSGEHDQLFGSVTSADIAHELEHKGLPIDRRKIQLNEPLKAIGEFNVPIKLHRDVVVPIKVRIQKDATAEAAASPAATEEAGAEA